ncbi:MAG: sugar phosphate isomerase/epimerase [Anaerolineae bacterium]|nr:sugar phosphate isomerase/epimerase [Anaerolineae bacterium]
MYLTGFADEAASDIAGQIRATQALGWTAIESRNVDGVNLHDLSDEAFDRVAEALAEAGVSVNCFGSAIANWGKSVLDPFEITLAEVKRAIPRMQRLVTPLIRIMSYAVFPDRDPDDQLEGERFRRMRLIHSMFTDAGLTPVHENCMNYGGMSWQHTLRLLDAVPGLQLVFDTGNPVFTDDRSKPKPYPKQSAWEFYTHVKEHIAYIHIKDGVWDPVVEQVTYTYPGEGQGDVRRILTDLLASGYDGGISIEPHMTMVHHHGGGAAPDDQRFENYVTYGRRLEQLLAEIRF